MRDNRSLFLERHGDLLASAPLPRDSVPHRDRWAATPEPRLLIPDNAVPHQHGGAGQPRLRAIAEAIEGFRSTFYPLWSVDEDWRDVYQTLPDDMEVALGLGAGRLEEFLESRTGFYDVLLVSRPPNMAVVNALRLRRPALFEGMRIVYDAEAIFALRDIGQAALQGRPMPRAGAKRLIRAEIDLTGGCDAVLAVSQREARLLRAGGAGDVRILSHAGDCRANGPGHAARQGLLFVGALHPDTPNEDSLVWFAKEILPVLNRRLGRAVPVTIVGACRSERIARLAGEQIRLAGRVADLEPIYDEARIFIAPTRFGAGVPLKAIEATLAGLPVVATQLLARQLGWRNDRELLAADTPETFAAQIAALYDDAGLWNRIRQAAQARGRLQFSPAAFSRSVNDVLAGRRPR